MISRSVTVWKKVIWGREMKATERLIYLFYFCEAKGYSIFLKMDEIRTKVNFYCNIFAVVWELSRPNY